MPIWRLRTLLAGALRDDPDIVPRDRLDVLQVLLVDPGLDPMPIADAGWHHLMATEPVLSAEDPAALAGWLEGHGFAREMLAQGHVRNLKVERPLTAMRRWLLLSQRWKDFPLSMQALAAQAAHSGGAWLMDAQERAALADAPADVVKVYRPQRPVAQPTRFEDAVTGKVAAQYEGWPYPAWLRINRPVEMRRGIPSAARIRIADAQQILAAGCGTGREAIIWASRLPRSHVLAIDLSAASLAIGQSRAQAMGLTNIEFRQMDLHRIGEVGLRFDFIATSGVLHHLPDPEAGWKALAQMLRPGGVMHVMLYSKLARLRVRGLRAKIPDLLDKPVDDDLLREVRARILSVLPQEISNDMFTLGGVHDLLLHRHEDAFDVARIARAIQALDMEFLGFRFQKPQQAAQYQGEYPDDPQLLSFSGWQAFELKYPRIFASMYDFWCSARP